MNEAEAVRRMMKRLNSLNEVYCLRTHGGSFQMKGTPDILGCAHGRFFAIEAKRSPKHRASPAQLYILGLLEKAGAKTFVCSDPNAEEVVKWIKTLE